MEPLYFMLIGQAVLAVALVCFIAFMIRRAERRASLHRKR
jgi:hypothetical protein